jgi:hypothetical protein
MASFFVYVFSASSSLFCVLWHFSLFQNVSHDSRKPVVRKEHFELQYEAPDKFRRKQAKLVSLMQFSLSCNETCLSINVVTFQFQVVKRTRNAG